ncbi:MAG: hypothetical protein RLO18_22870, partial [Gimesia chilikensis]
MSELGVEMLAVGLIVTLSPARKVTPELAEETVTPGSTVKSSPAPTESVAVSQTDPVPLTLTLPETCNGLEAV